LLAVMLRPYPMRAFISRVSPIPVVPLVMATHRVPVASHEDIAFTRTMGLYPYYADGRRRGDSNPDGKLRIHRTRCQQRQNH
jgi:hypothetical protein